MQLGPFCFCYASISKYVIFTPLQYMLDIQGSTFKTWLKLSFHKMKIMLTDKQTNSQLAGYFCILMLSVNHFNDNTIPRIFIMSRIPKGYWSTLQIQSNLSLSPAFSTRFLWGRKKWLRTQNNITKEFWIKTVFQQTELQCTLCYLLMKLGCKAGNILSRLLLTTWGKKEYGEALKVERRHQGIAVILKQWAASCEVPNIASFLKRCLVTVRCKQ